MFFQLWAAAPTYVVIVNISKLYEDGNLWCIHGSDKLNTPFFFRFFNDAFNL